MHSCRLKETTEILPATPHCSQLRRSNIYDLRVKLVQKNPHKPNKKKPSKAVALCFYPTIKSTTTT